MAIRLKDINPVVFNNNVGIGVASPSSKLEIVSTASNYPVKFTGTSGFPGYLYSDSNGFGIFSASATNGLYILASNGLMLQTGGVERLRINSLGNVGIGTSSPTTKFHVYGADGKFQSLGGQLTLDLQSGAGKMYALVVNPAWAPDSFFIYDRTGDNARITLDTVGNVGIGTLSPSQRLTVAGTLSITAGAGEQNLLMGNQDSAGANNPAIIKSANGSLWFGGGTSWVGNGGTFTSSMFLSDAGNVGVGTTTPLSKLHVNGGLMLGTNRYTVLDSSLISTAIAGIYVVYTIDIRALVSNGGYLEWYLASNPNGGGSGAYRRYASGRVTITTGWNGLYTPRILSDEVLFNNTGGSINAFIRVDGTSGTIPGDHETELPYASNGGNHLFWHSAPIRLCIVLTGGFNTAYPDHQSLVVCLKAHS